MKPLSFQRQSRHKCTVGGVGSHTRDVDPHWPFTSAVCTGLLSAFPSVKKKEAIVSAVRTYRNTHCTHVHESRLEHNGCLRSWNDMQCTHVLVQELFTTDLVTRDGSQVWWSKYFDHSVTGRINDLRTRSELVLSSFTSGLFCDCIFVLKGCLLTYVHIHDDNPRNCKQKPYNNTRKAI